MPSSSKDNSSLLIVAASQNACNSIKLVVEGLFGRVVLADTMARAKQKLSSDHFDTVIINTPLPDEFGVQSALDITAHQTVSMMLLVKADIFEKVSYMTRDSGIFVLTRPIRGQHLLEAAQVLLTMQRRISRMEMENQRMRRRLDDLGIITRAKCLLIEKQHLTEEQAHYYVEKAAMDAAISKKEAAQDIIARLEEL